jgi:Calcineurin-like phosphoesterase/Iron/zinc purple acid phosphatase-like protein C
MTSLGWNLGRVALWASFTIIALVRDHPQCIFEDSKHDIPTNLEGSAFPNNLYHQLRTPYQDFKCLPKHIHISQASDVDKSHTISMIVSFTLDFNRCKDAAPYVVFGRSWQSEERGEGTRTQFNFTSSLSGEYYNSDWIFHVRLNNLQAGSHDYWYQIVVEHNSEASRRLRGASDERTPSLNFKTPPLPGSPTSIALIGDQGQTVNSTKTMAHIFKATQKASFNPNPVSLVLIVGDMSYADSDPHRWPSWFELMEPLLRSTPTEVAAGNHEIECDNTTMLPFLPYEHYFQNPNRLKSAEIGAIDPTYRETLWNHSCSGPSQFLGTYNYGNSFYQFQHGLVQIIVLNSYSDTRPSSAQYKWLEGALKAVDRQITPWILVGFHCPLYTTFLGHNGEEQTVLMKKHMEPLFLLYGVNLIVSGHDHAYSRSHPVAFETLDPLAPVYFTLGAGGNREQHARDYLNPIPEDWVAKRDRFEYGYGNWFVQNSTHSYFTWVRDGTTTEGVHDQVWLSNPHV